MRDLCLAMLLVIFSLFVLFGCISGSGPTQIYKEPYNETTKVEVVVKNIEVPWGLDFLPNGDIVFTERPGRIRIIKNGSLTDRPLAEINVAKVGEAGLLGIAVDPEFENNNFIYAYYTYFDNEGQMLNRISRFTLRNYSATDEIAVLDRIPGGRGDQGIHNGGRIKFGPDGKLYITTGDGGVTANAQNLNSLAGKILRINKDGSIPEDNPFPNSPVYSYGHRNPQGLAWYKSGFLFASEHGPIGNDELNRIEAGKNYTWPALQCTDSGDPAVLCFTDTIAPSGMVFVGNDLYLSGLRGTQLRKITFDDLGTKVISQQIFLIGYGRIRDVVLGPDGYLYVLTSNRDGRGLPGSDDDQILRVAPS